MANPRRWEPLILAVVFLGVAGYFWEARHEKGPRHPELQRRAQASYHERVGDLLMRLSLIRELLPKEERLAVDHFEEIAVTAYKKALPLRSSDSLLPCKLDLLEPKSDFVGCEETDPELAALLQEMAQNPEALKRRDQRETRGFIHTHLPGYFRVETLVRYLELVGRSDEAAAIREEAAKRAMARFVLLALLGVGVLLLLVGGIIFLIYAAFRLNRLFPPLASPPIPWSVRDGALLMLFWAVVMVGPPLIRRVLSPSHGQELAGGIEGVVVGYCVQILLFLLGTAWFLRRRGHSPVAVGLTALGWRRQILTALGGYLALLPLVVGLALLSRLLLPAEKLSSNPIVPILLGDLSLGSRLLLGGMIVLAAPVMEELLFRGILYRTFRELFSPKTAVPLSAFLFSFLHADPMGFLPILGMGCVLAFLAERAGSILPGMIVHALWNGGSFLLTLLIS